MNKISYCITVCNERIELQTLLEQLNKYIRPVDEIVVLFDEKNGSDEVREYLETIENITLIRANFDNNFAEFKNKLFNYSTKDFIIQIDADELLTSVLIEYLPEIIDSNPDVELFWVPRINTLIDAPEEKIKQYVESQGWIMDENGWINKWDYQGRLYKNDYPRIKWEGVVHEKIMGAKIQTLLPGESYLAFKHEKTLSKQIKQNELYNKIH